MLRKRKQSVKENIEKLLHSRDHSDAAENISVAEETANYQPISSPEKIVEEIEVLKKKFKKDKHGERIEILKHGDIIDMRGTSLESNTISILSRKLKSHKKATKNVKLSEEERAKRREEMKLLD
jgi:hypothetical protein